MANEPPATRRLRVLAFSTLFPNAAQPVHGLFVVERLRHARTRADIRVVAPIPWFRRHPSTPLHRDETIAGMCAAHPPFFYVPGLFKCLDGIFLFLSSIRALAQIRREFDFDVIDAHFAFPDGFAAVLLGKWFGRPVTITLRGGELQLATYRLRRLAMQWCVQRAARVIAVSRELAGLAITLGAPANRVDIIDNGVDTGRFEARSRQTARRALGLPTAGRLVVSVGRLVPLKGFHRILASVPRVLKTVPDLTLAIVGGCEAGTGRYRRTLEALSRNLGLEGRVVFPGAAAPDDVVLWMNAADVLVLASDREGCPNVVLEALACGTPVVATRVGDVEHMVPADAGVLCAVSEDADVLGEALTAALTRRWDRTRIRAHARTRTWQAVAARVATQWELAVSEVAGAPMAPPVVSSVGAAAARR